MVDNSSAQHHILSCYKLSDYSVQDWVDQVWTAANNNEYKERLASVKVVADMIAFFKDTKTFEIDVVIDFCKRVQEEHDFVSLVLLLWTVYQRENVVGPSVYTEYVEETRAPLEKGFLPETPFDPISTKNEALQDALLKHYEKDGEPFYHRSQFMVILLLLETTLQREVVTPEEALFAKLIKARVSFLRDQSLNSSVVHLKDASLTLYKEYIAAVRERVTTDTRCREPLVLLLAEISYCQLHFYKYEQSE